jgi:hypothetical protein
MQDKKKRIAQDAFSQMMKEAKPDAKAFQDDFNQLAKKITMLEPYIANKKEISSYMAAKMECALNDLSVIYSICKSEHEENYI